MTHQAAGEIIQASVDNFEKHWRLKVVFLYKSEGIVETEEIIRRLGWKSAPPTQKKVNATKNVINLLEGKKVEKYPYKAIDDFIKILTKIGGSDDTVNTLSDLYQEKEINFTSPMLSKDNYSENNVKNVVAPAAELIQKQKAVYAYTFPDNYASRFYQSGGRFLVKIGCTEDNILKRIRNQVSKTAASEDPYILRVYECEDPYMVEKRIHKILKSFNTQEIGHFNGKEWFRLSEDNIDAIAEAMELKNSWDSDLQRFLPSD